MANPTLYMLPLTVLVQYLTNIGVIAAGASIVTQVAGSVSTLQTTYTDATGLVPNGNPMALNSAGRAAGASGALTAFWVLPGIVVDVYFTDVLGETWSIKGMAGINDPTVLDATFANPNTGFGADLIANAVRSYDVIATVRAANLPTLSGAQTLIIAIEGAALVNDGNGGLFYWSATSTAADDGGVTTIKPNALTGAQPGRYLRQTNLFGTQGTATLTFLGFSGSPPTTQLRWIKNGPFVSVSYNGAQGVSSSTSFSISGWPNGLEGPAISGQSPLVWGIDNGIFVPAAIQVQNQIGGNAVVSIGNGSGLWTGSGTKGLLNGGFTYVTG
jgi:hypothetical protein